MKTAVFTFGRMSPPTIGHKVLVDKVVSEAKKHKGKPMVFLSHTQDKKKNPLSYEKKIQYAKHAFGPIVVKSDSKTIIEVLQLLDRSYDKVVMVVGSDRVDSFDKLLNQYNGKEYNFKEILVVSAGERDPDADGVSGMSASKMREYAKSKDIANFKTGLPPELKRLSNRVMDDVRTGMGLSESTRSTNAWSIVRKWMRSR